MEGAGVIGCLGTGMIFAIELILDELHNDSEEGEEHVLCTY